MTTCKRMTGGCIKWLKQQNDSRVGTENREGQREARPKRQALPPKGRKPQEKRPMTQDNTEFMRAEVVIICSFAVAILLFLSNFQAVRRGRGCAARRTAGIFWHGGLSAAHTDICGHLFPSVQPGKPSCCHEAGGRGGGCHYGLRPAAAGFSVRSRQARSGWTIISSPP